MIRVEYLGDQTRLHVNIGGLTLITLTDSHTGLSKGDSISIAPQDPLYFDANGIRI